MSEQNVAILSPNAEFQLPRDVHTRIDRFSLLPAPEVGEGHRVVVMANVTATTSDSRNVNINVAVASFIVGQDFDQQCNIIVAPSDKCVLTTLGAPVPIQILYTRFKEKK